MLDYLQINVSRVPTVPKLTLHSIFPVDVLLGQLDSGLIAKPTDKNELKTLWKNANTEFKKFDPNRSILLNDDVKPLVLQDKEKISKTIERLSKYPFYPTHNLGIYDEIGRASCRTR